jgi:hypothetical protein
MLMNTSKIGIMVEVALDPTMGFGFSRELAKTSILRWDLDGQNVTAIATNRMKLHSDGGLALDLPRHLVYWMNANQQELSVTDYEGKKTTILRKQSEFGGIYHLKIFEDKILAGGYNVLTQFPKRNYSAPAKTWYMAKLLDFKPFSGHVQPYVPHPCSENNGGCEQICLVVFRADPKGRQAHAQCACSDGFVVSRYDIRRCQRYIACNTSGGRFQCATSGLCLDNWFRCNGLYDCHVNHEDGSHIEDKSDEEYCEDQMCPENQLRCHGGGSCIPLSWVCDSVMDCLDNSDENHCEPNCRNDSFLCRNQQCVPSAFQCDGDKDCEDGSDEAPEICSSYTCPHLHRKCSDGRTCVHKLRWCDKLSGCPSPSSEKESPGVTKPSSVDENREPEPTTEGDEIENNLTPAGEWSCESYDKFVCDNGAKISKKLVCDGIRQCEDGSDEDSCASSPCRIYGNCPQRCKHGWWSLLSSWSGSSKIARRTARRPPRPTSYKCHCAEGYIKWNGNQCRAKGIRPIVLVAGSQVLLEIAEYSYLRVRAVEINHFRSKGMDMAVHNGVRYLYWIDKNGTSIRRESVWLEYDQQSPHTAQPGPSYPSSEPIVSIGYSMDLAIDWLHHTVYWTNQQHRKIEMATLDGPDHFDILTESIEKPYAIVVSPEHGFIYWSDVGSSPRIERAYLDGSYPLSVVRRDLIYPTGLAFDYANERLYWADPKRRRIESVNLWGQNRVLVEEYEPGSYPAMHLDVFENYIYYTTYITGEVYKMHKFNGLADSSTYSPGLDESSVDRSKSRHGKKIPVPQIKVPLAAALIVWHASKHNVSADIHGRSCLGPPSVDPVEHCPPEAVCLSSPLGTVTCLCPRHTTLKYHFVKKIWRPTCEKVAKIDVPNKTSDDNGTYSENHTSDGNQSFLESDNTTNFISSNATSHDTSTAIAIGTFLGIVALILIAIGAYFVRKYFFPHQAIQPHEEQELLGLGA